MKTKKDIFIYNHGEFEFILDLILPGIKLFQTQGVHVHVLANHRKEAFKTFFSDLSPKLLSHYSRQKNLILRLIQLYRFCLKARTGKLIVLTENQTLYCRLLSKLMPGKCHIVLYKQGALAAERYFLSGSKLNHIFFRWIEAKSLKTADECIFVSHRMADYYKTAYNYTKPYTVINNKVPIPANFSPQPKSSDDPIEIVYSGSVSKWQNVDYVLQLFRNLEEIDGLKFKIISYCDYDFFKYGNTKLTVVKCEPHEVVATLSQSDLGIIVRDDNILNIVSSPLKIGEYLTAGLNIILTPNIGDYSGIVKKNELGCIISGTSIARDIELIKSYLTEFRKNRVQKQADALKLSQSLFADYSEYLNILS